MVTLRVRDNELVCPRCRAAEGAVYAQVLFGTLLCQPWWTTTGELHWSGDNVREAGELIGVQCTMCGWEHLGEVAVVPATHKLHCPDCNGELHVRLDFGSITVPCASPGDGEVEWDPYEFLGREPDIEGFHCISCGEEWDWSLIFDEEEEDGDEAEM